MSSAVSSSLASRIALTALGFLIVAGGIIFVVTIAGKQDEGVRIAVSEPDRSEPEKLKPAMAGLKSDKEAEQLNGAREILANPEQYREDLNLILGTFKSSKSAGVKSVLAEVLGKLGVANATVVDALSNALKTDGHYMVRLFSAKALRVLKQRKGGISDDEGCGEALIESFKTALDDSEEEVRMESMRFFFDNPNKEATAPLTSYIEKKDSKNRWKAIEVLGRIKDPSSAPVLLALLQDESADIPSRSRACAVLGLLKHEPALPVIQRLACGAPESEITKVAKETLTLFK